MVLYFVAFLIIGNFFIVNLFVGIILDKFSEEHKKGNNPLLTEGQANWVKVQCRIMGKPLKKTVPVPKHELRKAIYTIIESDIFDYCIMVCIVLNIAVMAMEHYEQVRVPRCLSRVLCSISAFAVASLALEKGGRRGCPSVEA